jgi:MoxR-like ATPase
VHDALKRRCFYAWVDFPDAARELAIVRAKCPGMPEKLSAQIVAFVQKLRREELFKLPGVAETMDWTNALGVLDRIALDPATIDDTLGALLKYQDDIAKVRGTTALKLLKEVEAEAAQ